MSTGIKNQRKTGINIIQEKANTRKKLIYDFFMLLYLDYIGFFATKFTSQTGEKV